MERRFEEKTVRKALQRGYVDAQRLLASPSQMQKFLLRLEEKEEVVRTVGEPLAAVPVLERLLRRYLEGAIYCHLRRCHGPGGQRTALLCIALGSLSGQCPR